MPDTNHLDPWPGYDDQSAAERERVLELKVTDAYQRGDLLYAKALSVAVAALEGAGGPDQTPLGEFALVQAEKIDGYGDEWFGDTGGWTPK
jgi:hypothetical protein